MPDPKPTFLQAVRALYATIAGLPTLWLDEAPETSDFPRAILRHGGESPEPDSFDETEGNASWNIATCDIELYAENDSDAAETMALAVRDAFRPDAIQLTFDANARIYRTGYVVRKAPDMSPNGRRVYVATISYRATFGTDD